MSFINLQRSTINQIKPDAKICFIADYPSFADAQVNQGYSDSAGSVLAQCLGHAGLSMAEASIIFVIPEPCSQATAFKFWTPKGGFTTQATAYFQQLKEAIKEANANVYVPLGEIGLQALTNKKGITKWRGSILESISFYSSIKVIPSIDPRTALRQYLYRYYLSYDLKRAKEESFTTEIDLPKRNLIVQPSYTEALAFLDHCKKVESVAVDIEVYKMEVSCISFAPDSLLCMSIPFDARWTLEEEKTLWLSVADLLENPKISKKFQNGMFDISFLLSRNNIIVQGYIHDTMVKHHLNYPDFPKGLGFITSLYTREPYYKDEGKTWFNDLKGGTGSIDQFYIYNAKDSAVTFEADGPITIELERYKNTETYEFNQKLFKPLLYMCARGILVDESALAEHRKEARETRDKLQEKLNELCGFNLNVSSPVQCKKYFYETLNLPKQMKKSKDSKTGLRKESVSSDDKAMKRLIRKFNCEEAKLVTQIRKYRKLIGTYLEVCYDDDKRLRCSFNMAGTATGRLSSSETIFGTGCLLPEAEILTPDGWVAFKDLTLNEYAMQWSADGILSFTKPKFHKFKFSGNMQQAMSHTHRNVYTPDHRIPTYGHRKNILTVKSAKDASGAQFYLPTGGKFDGKINLTGMIKLLVAVQADGCIEGSNIRFAFKKDAKKTRLIELLESLGISYTDQKDNREGYNRFCIGSKGTLQIANLLGKEKNFGSWLLDCSQETLQEFIQETKYWDSTVRGNSWIYSTVNYNNAQWVATIAHLTGYIATIRCNTDNNRGYGSGNNKPLWNVNIKPGTFATVEKQHWSEYPYNGFVYCIETESSFFLTRYKGQITVTGNTNMQNLPKSFKKFLIADPGHVIVEVDKAQAEWVATAYVSGDARMIEACENNLDAHVHTANLMFGIPKELIFKEHEAIETSTDEDYILEQRQKHCPEILQYRNILPNMSCRQAGKKSNHSFNYGLSPQGFAIQYDMELKYAKQCHALYHNAYPGLSLWHQHIRNKLGKDRTLENLFGRKRRFLNRWNEDLFKAAYSYIPQSTVGQLLNYGIVETYYQQDLPEYSFLRDWDLLNQVHDSMVFQYPIDKLDDLVKTIKQIQKNLDPKLYCNGRQFVIKTDCKIGINCKDLYSIDIYAEQDDMRAQVENVIKTKINKKTDPIEPIIDIEDEEEDQGEEETESED